VPASWWANKLRAEAVQVYEEEGTQGRLNQAPVHQGGHAVYKGTQARWESLFRDQVRFEKLEAVWERGDEEHGFGHWRSLSEGAVAEEHVEEEEELNFLLSLPGDAGFQVARPWKQQHGLQCPIKDEESEDEESEDEEETES